VHDEVEPVGMLGDLCSQRSGAGWRAHIDADRIRNGARCGDFGGRPFRGCFIL
jgi:hypothetical protein